MRGVRHYAKKIKTQRQTNYSNNTYEQFVSHNNLSGGISEFGKNRTLSEQVATRDAIVKHFVIYGIVLILD